MNSQPVPFKLWLHSPISHIGETRLLLPRTCTFLREIHKVSSLLSVIEMLVIDNNSHLKCKFLSRWYSLTNGVKITTLKNHYFFSLWYSNINLYRFNRFIFVSVLSGLVIWNCTSFRLFGEIKSFNFHRVYIFGNIMKPLSHGFLFSISLGAIRFDIIRIQNFAKLQSAFLFRNCECNSMLYKTQDSKNIRKLFYVLNGIENTVLWIFTHFTYFFPLENFLQTYENSQSTNERSLTDRGMD